MINSKFALTTFDNPYNPFTQFIEWFMFDIEKGYNSCGYIGRIAATSDSLTDEENDEEVERAIDEIVKNDFLNIYLKVTNNGQKTGKINMI